MEILTRLGNHRRASGERGERGRGGFLARMLPVLTAQWLALIAFLAVTSA